MASGNPSVPVPIKRAASATKQLKNFLSRILLLVHVTGDGRTRGLGLRPSVDVRPAAASPAKPGILMVSRRRVLSLGRAVHRNPPWWLRKVRFHRALGWFGAALAATMFVSGMVVSPVMLRFEEPVLHGPRVKDAPVDFVVQHDPLRRSWPWLVYFRERPQ